MENINKLETISNLFEDNEIRSVWDSEKEEYYFSVVDVIQALTDSNNPRNYWNTLKRRMTEEEKSELYAKCVQLKMKSQKDGKRYLTDALDTKGILRLIESVPSPKAEPFKLWLAQMTDIEVTLTDLGEIATRELAKKHKPYGLKENKEIAKRGGKIAKITRDNLEKELGESVITNRNALNYKYLDDNKLAKNLLKGKNDRSSNTKKSN